MSVFIENEIEAKFDFDYEDVIKKVIDKSLEYINCPYEACVEVTITDSETIREINNEHRQIDRATDVLSFPMIEYETPGDFTHVEDDFEDCFDPDSGELLLGDIVLCREKITEQAKEYGHSELRELAFLTAHSMFHLFGYDHMTDEERVVMEAKQEDVLKLLNITRDL